MNTLEPGSITLADTSGLHAAELIAVSPVNRDQLQFYVASIRQSMFQGVQVPITVTQVDPATGTQWVEHIPGCATCTI